MSWVWFPLKQIVRFAARRHGFIDPAILLARIEAFGQPSEVAQPIELLRAGVVLHARGLVNARVIQHNLDWVWPLWVERQFDPTDPAFIPRAFSITHVNLSHRSWTGLGVPRAEVFPIVDPHGLVTPQLDGWSIDVWVLRADGSGIVPSRMRTVAQSLDCENGWTVRTSITERELRLSTKAACVASDGVPELVLEVEASGGEGSVLAVAVRPYNPEGISFIEQIAVDAKTPTLSINGRDSLRFSVPPSDYVLSTFRAGDSFHRVPTGVQPLGSAGGIGTATTCKVGLASAVARFALEETPRTIEVRIPLSVTRVPTESWENALAGHCRIDFGDERLNHLYAASVGTLILLSPGDIYPGPYTYRRFWFRDAGFIMNALLMVGLAAPAERCIDRFALRQTSDGYLASQAGEWDSNGVGLWAIERYCALAHRLPSAAWFDLVRDAADWIIAKRVSEEGDARHRGLLPAGFSAEHLGPNDFYFWDDYWGVAGLEAAGALFDRYGRPALAAMYRGAALDFRRAIDRAVVAAAATFARPAIPASPYRRMDAGAIGSIVGAYPLEIVPPTDPYLSGTVDYLFERCCRLGAFFQDMIHSGLNPYLTLHLAQVLLRQNDPRAHALFERVGELASPTAQWPEAVHPRTGGGCMGDGHHAWASAEWAVYCRSMFVREEGGALRIGTGLPIGWLRRARHLWCRGAATPFGTLTVEVESDGDRVNIRWWGEWYGEPPPIEVGLLGGVHRRVDPPVGEATFELIPDRDGYR